MPRKNTRRLSPVPRCRSLEIPGRLAVELRLRIKGGLGVERGLRPGKNLGVEGRRRLGEGLGPHGGLRPWGRLRPCCGGRPRRRWWRRQHCPEHPVVRQRSSVAQRTRHGGKLGGWKPPRGSPGITRRLSHVASKVGTLACECGSRLRRHFRYRELHGSANHRLLVIGRRRKTSLCYGSRAAFAVGLIVRGKVCMLDRGWRGN